MNKSKYTLAYTWVATAVLGSTAFASSSADIERIEKMNDVEKYYTLESGEFETYVESQPGHLELRKRDVVGLNGFKGAQDRLSDPDDPFPPGGGTTDPFPPGGGTTDPTDPFPPGGGGGFPPPFPFPGGGGFFGDGPLVIIDQIVNIGERIWNIVAANRPVVNAGHATANAVPKGISDWSDLRGWKMPRSLIYRVKYKNVYGSTVVDFSYRMVYTYNGGFNGKGKYLANMVIEPADLSVAWGYTFDSGVRVADVINTGSKDEPVAGMEVVTAWKIRTILKHMEQSSHYFIQGDGKLTDLSRGRK